MSGARAFLAALGLGELVTRDRAGKVELHCPAPVHTDRRPSAVTFEDSLVTSCYGCGQSWSPFELALERGLERLEALELCIRFGVREERRREAPGRPHALRTLPPVSRPTESPGSPRALPLETVERLERALAGLVAARRDHDRELEELRGFDPRLLDLLGVGWGRADALPGFGRFPAGPVERVLVPVRELSGRLLSVVAFLPRPGAMPADERVRKSAVPRDVARFPLIARPLELAVVGAGLLCVEGEPDALGASVGLAAIGVPGLANAARHAPAVVEAARAAGGPAVILVPDGDAGSRQAFLELGRAIASLGLRALYRPVMAEGRDLGDAVLGALAGRVPASPLERFEAGRRLYATLTAGGSMR